MSGIFMGIPTPVLAATPPMLDVRCPKTISKRLPKCNEVVSISTYLLECYQAVESTLKTEGLFEVFPELKQKTFSGVVPFQCVLIRKNSLMKCGYPSDVKLTGAWNAETKHLISYQVETKRIFGLPFDKVANGRCYPRGSVVDRALRLKAISAVAERKPIIQAIDFGVGNISWPSSEIKGVGYTVQVILSTLLADGDQDEAIAFGAFPLLRPQHESDILAKTSGNRPTSADVLSISGIGEADDGRFIRR